MRRRCRLTVPPHGAGVRLVDFLAGRFSYLGGTAWAGEIENGRVLLNGRSTGADAVLQPGDRLFYTPEDLEEPPVDGAFGILFEDDAILAVHKPGNLPCHPGGRYFRHTLWAMLKERTPELDLRFVHRLDRETSGVVLLAKDSRDASILGRQMSQGVFRKRYVALVEGRFPNGPVTAEGIIGPDRASAVRMKMRFLPKASAGGAPLDGKLCRTRFRRLRTGPALSLVSAAPATGRRHQIRATLLQLGYPVVGDKIYGVDDALFIRFIEDRLDEGDRARLRLGRQALHAASLVFHHPRTGKKIAITAPTPEIFASLAGGA